MITLFVTVTLFITILVVFILIYVFLHQQKMTRYNLLLKEQELRKQQELFLALHEGEEKERKRLAEELHDGIGAKLSGLKMSLEYLKQHMKLNDDNEVVFDKLGTGMHEAIDELREISGNLQPGFLSSKGLQHAINDFVENLNRQNTCRYESFIVINHEQISNRLQLILFRIVCELLTNVHKHAIATQASVQVIPNEHTIQVVVEDNGIGFSEQGMNGIGLINLRNRVELCRGTLNIDSGTNGTVIIVEIPLISEA